jgi:hypothetical protein
MYSSIRTGILSQKLFWTHDSGSNLEFVELSELQISYREPAGNAETARAHVTDMRLEKIWFSGEWQTTGNINHRRIAVDKEGKQKQNKVCC